MKQQKNVGAFFSSLDQRELTSGSSVEGGGGGGELFHVDLIAVSVLSIFSFVS